MKKIFLVMLPTLLLSFTTPFDPVNDRVLQAFHENFGEVKDITWHESNGLYVVNFMKEDVRYSISYDKDGRFISSRRSYFANTLPMNILLRLKEKYKGKSIYGVTEIIEQGTVVYYIKLEDKSSWWTVRVSSHDFIEVTEKLKKS